MAEKDQSRSRLVGFPRLLGSQWRYAPAAIACVYGILLVEHLPSIIAGLSQSSDGIVPGVLAKLMSSHSGTVWLGTSNWYSTLLLDLVTRGLPFYRAVWEAAPFVVAALGFAAVAWSVLRVAGRWPATVCLSLLTCASAPILLQLAALDTHGLTWFSDALLVAGLIWVLDRAQPASRSRWLPAAVVTGLIVSLNLASDPLLYLGGIVPLLCAAAYVHFRARSSHTAQGLRYALVTSAIAIVGSLLVSIAMGHEHIVHAVGFTVALAPLSLVRTNFADWAGSIQLLGGEPSASTTTGLGAVISRCAADLLLLGVVLIPQFLLTEFRTSPRRNGAPARSAARQAFVVAWSISAALISLAFVFSTAPVGTQTSRYLIGVAIAAAALLPLQARSRMTTGLVTAAASVYCVSGVLSLASIQASLPQTFTAAQTDAFVRLARREDVKSGYAGWWQAPSLTWLTDFRLQAYPAVACGSGLCEFGLGSTSAWYSPHGHQRSFLITDVASSDAGRYYMPSAPKSLGRPIATFKVGERYRFVVYGYDIASRITKCLRSTSVGAATNYVPLCPRSRNGATKVAGASPT
jgi:hypothetical protein